jgi:ABC-type transporter Mla MlaB component
MLKITRVQTIKVEGELLEPWVGAVRDACTTPDRRSRHLRLDLAAVNYVDAAGVHLLRELMREGIEIAACSRFIGELLHLEDSGQPGAGAAPEPSPPPPAPSDRP